MITFVEFTFEAAHQIPPFSSLHGHTFCVEVWMSGETDPVYGWSANLDEVESVIEGIKAQIDHKYLNDIPGLEVPSLENVARWLHGRLAPHVPGIERIMVRRGAAGHGEGCIYQPRLERRAPVVVRGREDELVEA